MVIELIRGLIRPLTLTIRLISNMLAGHLIMSLLGTSIINISLLKISFMFVPITLLSFLELAVSIIQAYVFSTLVTLYLGETA